MFGSPSSSFCSSWFNSSVFEDTVKVRLSKSHLLPFFQGLIVYSEQSNSFWALSKSQQSSASSFSQSLLTAEGSTPKSTADTWGLITGMIQVLSKTGLKGSAPSSSTLPLLSAVLSLSVWPLPRPPTQESPYLQLPSRFSGASQVSTSFRSSWSV